MKTLFIIFIIAVTVSITFADLLEPQIILKAYKSGEKICKQIALEHEGMRGQHEIMFKSWQEKSAPFLSEDEETLKKCNETVLLLKQIREKIDYEKNQEIIRMVVSRHRRLKEEHETLFHEMMGH